MSRAVQHVLNISCFNGLTNHSSLFQTWHSSSQWQESTSISEAAWGGKNESELNSLSCSQTKEYGQARLGSAVSTPNDSPTSLFNNYAVLSEWINYAVVTQLQNVNCLVAGKKFQVIMYPRLDTKTKKFGKQGLQGKRALYHSSSSSSNLMHTVYRGSAA